MLVDCWLGDAFELAVDDGFLELLQGFCVVTQGFGLRCESLTDEVFLLGSDVFGQGGGDEPILDVAAHIQSVERFRRFQVVFLSQIVLA